MAVLKLKYKRNGRIKKIKTWYIDFRDHNGISRRMPGYHDKGATENLEKEITNLIRALKANLPISISEAKQELMKRDTKVKNSLIKFGLLEAATAPKTLAALVDEFKASIPVTLKKGRDYTQADQLSFRVGKIIADCQFDSWDDVNEDKINLYLHELDLKKGTKKFYVTAFRRFARWMIRNGHAQTAPELNSIKVPKRPERHFEPDEYQRLLETARTGLLRYGMSGVQRYMVYWTAVETGLRKGELEELTSQHFDFSRCKVFVPGEGTKNSNSAYQNITPELNGLLKEYCRGLEPDEKLFNLPHKAALMIQADCKAAGIAVRTLKGKLKFHSLRHTCASFYLAATGNIQLVCDIMRHSNITLTVNLYGHLLQGQRESAIAKMSKFTAPQAKADKAIA